MLTENHIVKKMTEHLKADGHEILQSLSTDQKGIDIISQKDGLKMYVEAKGETSSREGSKRFGKPFSKNQVGTHIAVAILASMKSLAKYSKNSRVAIALPDNQDHRTMIGLISPVLKKTAIEIYFVSEITVEKL